jgi:prevent-host-death family protein
MQVSIYEAKTHLSRLIEAVEGGQEVVIARRNRPVVRIVPAASSSRRRCGALAGRPFRMGEDFDSPKKSAALADAFGIPSK